MKKIKMKKVINKGYTLTVISWENDADNYNTKSKTVDTLEEAKVWYEMMQLCKSQSNIDRNDIKLGNTSYEGFNKQQEQVAIDFMKEHHAILIPGESLEDEDLLVDWFTESAGELLGYGEYYACRVCESVNVTYSPEDIFLEEITF